tara:strand:- start:237 stop:587 length:351 start_codon:yes stop_codon:yes gene_type:complete
MISDEATDKLNALDVALFGERYRGILDSGSAPFDVSRPNFHDNKADFLKELMTVQAVLNHCDGVLNTIAVYDEELSSENVPEKFSLAIAINVSGLQDRARKRLSTSSLVSGACKQQ